MNIKITWTHAGQKREGWLSRQLTPDTYEVVGIDDGRRWTVHRKVITNGLSPEDPIKSYDRAMSVI